jgi:hypothetical protein
MGTYSERDSKITSIIDPKYSDYDHDHIIDVGETENVSLEDLNHELR